MTLAALICVYLAIDGLVLSWTPTTRILFQFLCATSAIAVVHLPTVLTLRNRLGDQVIEPEIGLMYIAPFHVLAFGRLAPLMASIVVSKLMGEPYFYAAFAALAWYYLYDRQTSAHLAYLLKTKAPTLWPANDEEAVRQKKRLEDRAGHALAAFYLLMPLAAAVAIVVVALLRD